MGKKISQFPEITNPTGEEELLLAFGGENFKAKLKAINNLVNKVTLGLDRIDNTSDLDKPISTATQIALNVKAPIVHAHEISDTEGLQEVLDAKSDIKHTHTTDEILGLSETLTGINARFQEKAELTHVHGLSEIIGLSESLLELQESLTKKAENIHTHVITDIQGLLEILNGINDVLASKADLIHSHIVSDIEGLDTHISDLIEQHAANDPNRYAVLSEEHW